MQNNYAYKNYTNTDVSSAPQNELEARALLKTAADLHKVKEHLDIKNKQSMADFRTALELNRKLWTVLVSNLKEEDHPMPLTIRTNIANLAYFIFSRTIDLIANPVKEKLDILININKNIASGLYETPSKKLPVELAEDAAELIQKPLANQNNLTSPYHVVNSALTPSPTSKLNITS